MMEDIEKETVDFQPTYDDSSVEPTVLPTVLPNLLVNGAAGIAVGMATNIPPHNLGEVVDGLTFLLENQDLTPDERLEGLIARIHGPDFPTAGFIMGRAGIESAYRTGRGSIVMRARSEIETRKGDRESIVISEIPYQVNKARLIEKIAELARDEKIRGIQDVRDESDRQGMRIVVDVKKGEPAQVVLNNLYKHTPLQDTLRRHLPGDRRAAAARAEPARGLRAVPRLPARRGASAHAPTSCARPRRAPTSSKAT